MSRNRRETNDRVGQRTLGNFIRLGGQRSRVEISDDEDDEVEEINTHTDRSSRLRTRRQKREAARDEEFCGDVEGNEEWDQLQQVLLMSKIEAEKQEERRKMCGNMQDVMNLQVELEPLSSSSLKNRKTETTSNTTGDEKDQREDTTSPDMFSTPPEDQEDLSDNKAAENVESDTECPNSPSLPVTMRSPDAVSNDDGNKKKSPSTEPSSRQEKGETRRRLKLRRTRQEETSEKNADIETKSAELEITEEKRQSENDENVAHGEKRKLEQDNADDDTDDEDHSPVLKRRVSLKRKKLTVELENSDSEVLQDSEKKGSKRAPDKLSDPMPKRIAVGDSDNETTKNKEDSSFCCPQPPSIRFSRQYKKPRCRPTTLKEAMKANLYFAPPGFDRPTYKKLIIKMFERYRRQLHIAQSKIRTCLPWGPPVVAGYSSRIMDLRLPGKTSVGGRSSAFVRGMPQDATSADVRKNFEQDASNRRRTLRSSANLVNQATASTSTSTSTHETLPSYKVDSDSDDEGLMKSYLDEVTRPSVVSFSKKAKHSTENDGSSTGGSADLHEPEAQAEREPLVKTQTLRNSNFGLKDNSKTTKSQAQSTTSDTKIPTRDGLGGSDVLFGSGVVLDSNSSQVQSNAFDTSDQMLGKDAEGMEKFKTSESKLDGHASAVKDRGLPEDSRNKDDVVLMDTDENQSDDIQPPKRRSVLRPLDDDSTDDEGDLSQAVFSTNQVSADCEVSSSKKDIDTEFKRSIADVEDEVSSDDTVPLDSPSIVTQSESQGILGKSVLDIVATGDETLLSSQVLSESHSSATGSISSTTKPAAKRVVERCTVDVDSDDSQHMKRKRSEAAERAAAAAERRQQQLTRGQEERALSSSSHFGSSVNRPVESMTDTRTKSAVECPLCYRCFTSKEIEQHASDCQGPPPSPQASYSQTQREEVGAPSVRSSAPRTFYKTLSGERGQLKNLKVLLQRSPMAKEKLLEKANQPTDSAKRNLEFEKSVTSPGIPGKLGNLKVVLQTSPKAKEKVPEKANQPTDSTKQNLDFDKKGRMPGSLDQCIRPFASSPRSFDQGSSKHVKNTRAALRTESESERSGYENEGEEEVYSWLDSTSPEKKRPQQTYGGNISKRCDDYIPLETARQSEGDGSTFKTSKEHGSKPTSSGTEGIESSSNASDEDDDAIMVQYGAQRESRRPRTESKKEVTGRETDENEDALAQLSGRKKKRPLSVSKSSKPKRPRRLRDSDSEDSDELTMVCFICNEKIPKELYDKHVEQEVEERKRTGGAPRKVEVVTVKDRTKESSRGKERRVDKKGKTDVNVPSQSSGPEHRETNENDDDVIDWDAVSDSPIKCFQFTENSTSGVDFQNQFEHLKEKKGGKRRGNQERYEGSNIRRGYGQSNTRGGYRGSGSYGEYGGNGNRGRGRGSYNKVFGRGRGKKYRGKSWGYRGKK